MPKEQYFKGKKCRYYINEGIWVSRDGKVAVYIEYTIGEWGIKQPKMHSLRIQHDDEHQYVRHPWHGNISIARAVITCWCPPIPNDGKSYTINYKDGNRLNCNASNLEWVEYHYQHTQAESVQITLGINKLTICKDGTVKKNGEILSAHEDGAFDPDMDLYFPGHEISVSLDREKSNYSQQVPVDKLMNYAGYVQGDDAILVEPVILHKDLDWKNCGSDNLEWVEKSDQRYKDYQDKILEARKAISDKINYGRPVPDYWIK